MHYGWTYQRKKPQRAVISAEDAKLPVSRWPSLGLCTLSSLNDRRCKYTITLSQARDHPGDTHKLSVCV